LVAVLSDALPDALPAGLMPCIRQNPLMAVCVRPTAWAIDRVVHGTTDGRGWLARRIPSAT
jgi:hypothetical protein